MKKQNYEEIVKIIKSRIDLPRSSAVPKEFVNELADYFEKERKSDKSKIYDFNKEKFLKACGVEK